MNARIHYADTDGPPCPLEVSLIATWDRDAITPVSGSSGLKDYFKNQVWSIFAAQPHIHRILMLRANGPTFFLFLADTWRDLTGRPVTIEPTGQEPAV
jgi:hypothetical protein